MRDARVAFGVALVLVAVSTRADAQPSRRFVPAPGEPQRTSTSEENAPPPNVELRARFGVDLAQRLVRSPQIDDRIRGIERAAASGTPESILALVAQAESGTPTRASGRAMIALARALAKFAANEKARAALVTVAGASSPAARRGRDEEDSADDSSEEAERFELAREIAALALARAGDAKTEDAIVSIARGGGAGRQAARAAIVASPPSATVMIDGGVVPSHLLDLLPYIADLRTLDAARSAARASDPDARAAAIEALGRMGDGRVAELAKAGLDDADPRVRVASGDALVSLASPDAAKAVEKLLADDKTARGAVVLAQRISSEAIVRTLGSIAKNAIDLDVREDAVRALGRSVDPLAARTLLTLEQDPVMRADASQALGRSPAPIAMAAIIALMTTPPGIAKDDVPVVRRLAARAYLVRAIVRGERSDDAARAIEALSASRDLNDRAVATLVRTSLAAGDVRALLADKTPEIRRAAATGCIARTEDAACDEGLVERLLHDNDASVRVVSAIALLDERDAGARLTTMALVDRAESGGPDAPLAALALARRATDDDERGATLLESADPVIRAHAALGLARSADRHAPGRLARAYTFETNAAVRRAIILGLAAAHEVSPVRKETLDLARSLDPDTETRAIAARALIGAPPMSRAPARDVAWIRLADATGGAPPRGAVAMLVTADGVAIPIAFDDEGFAIVPGVAPGAARLVLAPRIP